MGIYSNRYIPNVIRSVKPNNTNQVGFIFRTNDNEGKLNYKNDNFAFTYSDGSEVNFNSDYLSINSILIDENLGYSSASGIWFGDGDTGIYQIIDDYLRIKAGGYTSATATPFGVTGGTHGVGKGLLSIDTATSTSPSFRFYGDDDTGIGRASDDQLSLIAGGIEGARIEEGNNGTSGTHIFIPNLTTAPTSNPTGGGYLYVEGGELKYRGSSGTVTVIASA